MTTANALDLAGARAALAAIGRRLDELAHAGSEETVLDGLLAAMRQIHDGIIEHLTAATRTTPAAAEQQPRLRRLQSAA